MAFTYFQQDANGKLHLMTMPAIRPQPVVGVDAGDRVTLREGSFPVAPRLTRKRARTGLRSIWLGHWRACL